MSSPTDSGTRAGTLDDLRRVIRRIEHARPLRVAPELPETVLGGQLVETDAGPLLTVRREFPLDHRHGDVSLDRAFAISTEALGALARDEAAPDVRGLLFLDTETTGLSGGTGTYAFLVGAGFLEGDRFVIVQHFMRDLDEEPALLAALAPLLARASAIVTFNGSSFDVPLLETRFVLGRRRWPATLRHLDLVHPSRRVWATRFADCRLSTLEQEVLGHRRDHDVPGSMIPSLYFDFLRRRRAGPLAGVFRHNCDDLLSLTALLGWLAHALSHGERGIDDAFDLVGVARLWERSDPERAVVCYRAALAVGLPAPAAHAVRLRLASWEKRWFHWDAARTLWEEAASAASFDPRPWEELAKYHEHRARNAATARALVARALDLARAAGSTGSVLEAFSYRLTRLDRRLTNVGGGERRSSPTPPTANPAV
ncbi:MAG TPA: ribonuclease H-like domain-containing protein [Candidatus Acidoferrum sp.]|nr:ribonuclease H-like domain-containing protein [Candidatus Acidoferrum sp.]